MAGLPQAWKRSTHEGRGGTAEVLLVCFSTSPLAEDVPFRVDRFGVPSVEAARAVEVRLHKRREGPGWFDGWRTGALRLIAKRDLDDELSALDDSDQCHTLSVKADDNADLDYLQACWAIARWHVSRGAQVVLDARAVRFLTGGALAAVPPDSPFDVRREVSLVYETDARLPDDGHVLHTRGMRKLGRPDVVAVVGPRSLHHSVS